MKRFQWPLALWHVHSEVIIDRHTEELQVLYRGVGEVFEKQARKRNFFLPVDLLEVRQDVMMAENGHQNWKIAIEDRARHACHSLS